MHRRGTGFVGGVERRSDDDDDGKEMLPLPLRVLPLEAEEVGGAEAAEDGAVGGEFISRSSRAVSTASTSRAEGAALRLSRTARRNSSKSTSPSWFGSSATMATDRLPSCSGAPRHRGRNRGEEEDDEDDAALPLLLLLYWLRWCWCSRAPAVAAAAGKAASSKRFTRRCEASATDTLPEPSLSMRWKAASTSRARRARSMPPAPLAPAALIAASFS